MAAGVASQVLDRLWETAERLVTGGVTRSHDLTGIVFQRLIADRKFLATFYTRPASAALLAGLTLPADKAPGGADWGDVETLAAMQIGDFACGTGTLLSAAYQRVSLLHELHGGDPEKLHGPMMEHGLAGLDVLNSAVHLTATMLAATHPSVPFGGECLLVMPYGRQEHGVAIGSLDLLAAHVAPDLIGQATATTAGGRSSAEVMDLVSRIGHGKFDVVIMNPPFTRPTNHEGTHAAVPIPAFAPFETSAADQSQMSRHLAAVRGPDGVGHGNAGLASDFADLAIRKLRMNGTVALVLPLSAASGLAWRQVRDILQAEASCITVVSIAGPGSFDASFSADTGIAEILLIAEQVDNPSKIAETDLVFLTLRQRPAETTEADAIVHELSQLRSTSTLKSIIESDAGGTPLLLGDQVIGEILDCPASAMDQWFPVDIADLSLAQLSYQITVKSSALSKSRFSHIALLPTAIIDRLADIGPLDRDITGTNPDGSARGPFERIMPAMNQQPSYPMLSAHRAKFERQLRVDTDSEGRIRSMGGQTETLFIRAQEIWSTASRCHHTIDLQFNSQSLIVAITDDPCLGGRAWPSIRFEEERHMYAFALWSNSTMGLLMHWWRANKSQSGRGSIPLSGIGRIESINVRALQPEQHATAKRVFEELSSERFLPFDQIDEDLARAELDRRLLVEVLGLPGELCEPGGAMELLRRKLAAEPQIHGGKKTRIIFEDLDEPDPKTGLMWRERTERRDDR